MTLCDVLIVLLHTWRAWKTNLCTNSSLELFYNMHSWSPPRICNKGLKRCAWNFSHICFDANSYLTMNISRMEHRSSLRLGKEHPEYLVPGEINPMQRFGLSTTLERKSLTGMKHSCSKVILFKQRSWRLQTLLRTKPTKWTAWNNKSFNQYIQS